MSWRDQLEQASFRSVPFKVLRALTEVGRRVVVHQFPFSNVPYVTVGRYWSSSKKQKK